MIIVLGAVTLIAAALLGIMQQITKEPIEAVNAKILSDGIKKVMPGADASSFDVQEDTEASDKDFTVYNVMSQGKPFGKAIKSTVTGFSPGLTVLTGFDMNGKILGYEILASGETPGLGAKANTWFQEGSKGSIIGRNIAEGDLVVSKDDKNAANSVDAITASTITSRAFLKAVNAQYKALFGNGAAEAQTGATKPAETDTAVAAAVVASIAGEQEAPKGGPLTIQVVEVEE